MDMNLVFFNFGSIVFRGGVNAKRGQLGPAAAAEIDDADRIRAHLEAAKQPRSKESADYNKQVLKAISQHNNGADLTVLDIKEYMDQARE